MYRKKAETIEETAFLWYNIFMKTINYNNHYTPIQMGIPVDLEKIIENSDPIYTFNEIMEQIDLYKYFAEKGSKTGRPKFDSVKLLKIILFAFMENGYASVGNIEKLFKSRGKKRTIIAIERMILTAIYNMISTGEVWNLCDLFKIEWI